MKIDELHALIAAVCPIISINSDGVIVFDQTATATQKASAQNVMSSNLPLVNGIPVVPPPNIIGFQNAIKSAAGGIVGANTLATSYPLLSPAIEQQIWVDVQSLIIDAQTKLVINSTQYGAIKNAASMYSIPINLP